jgi:hypothetical protein
VKPEKSASLGAVVGAVAGAAAEGDLPRCTRCGQGIPENWTRIVHPDMTQEHGACPNPEYGDVQYVVVARNGGWKPNQLAVLPGRSMAVPYACATREDAERELAWLTECGARDLFVATLQIIEDPQ